MRIGHRKHEFGFTLIELIVAVAIIAMILSFIVASLSDSKARGRDARREQDIKQLQSALSLYASDNQMYPICPRGIINGTTDCLSPKLIVATFMMGVPTDPLGDNSGSCGAEGSFAYCYTSSDGSSYIIEYALETDTIMGKLSGWQTVESQP